MPDDFTVQTYGERIITLERHILDSQRDVPTATGAFSRLLGSIGLAAKVISREVRRAGLNTILGMTGDTNVQGERVTKLDVYSHRLMVRMMGRSEEVCGMASEESEGFIEVPPDRPRGRYLVAFDPLDGSSNIDANASIGTIFGIWRRDGDAPVSEKSLLQPGDKLAGAGYVLYGSSTIFVYSAGRGVHGFTLDPTIGEFLLSHRDIRIPERAKIYSVNEGNTTKWDKGVRDYVASLKGTGNALGKPYSSRYIGSLVADFHRNLLYGGIFMYPADHNNPNGKLRYLFEAAPLAYLAEQAGGGASNGHGRILEAVPDELHMRTPLYIGSRLDVAEAEGFVSGARPEAAAKKKDGEQLGLS